MASYRIKWSKTQTWDYFLDFLHAKAAFWIWHWCSNDARTTWYSFSASSMIFTSSFAVWLSFCRTTYLRFSFKSQLLWSTVKTVHYIPKQWVTPAHLCGWPAAHFHPHNNEPAGAKRNVKAKKKVELLSTAKNTMTCSLLKQIMQSHLNFHDSDQLCCRLRDTELPFRATTAIPESREHTVPESYCAVKQFCFHPEGLKLAHSPLLTYQKFLGSNWWPSIQAMMVFWPSIVFP